MTSTETAVSLMRMALALLDRAGETDAAARLRSAIEAMTGHDTLTATRTDGEELSASPAYPTAMRAR